MKGGGARKMRGTYLLDTGRLCKFNSLGSYDPGEREGGGRGSDFDFSDFLKGGALQNIKYQYRGLDGCILIILHDM